MEALQEKHRIAILVYENKVTHIEYDHKNALDAINDAIQSLEITPSEEEAKRRDLKETKQQLRLEQTELELANLREIEDIRRQHQEQLQKLSQQFRDGLHELTIRCEARRDAVETDYELRRRVDLHEVEERKNRHINQLISNHKQSFQQMKEYYQKITQENLNLIKNLQQQIRELKNRSDNSKSALQQCRLEHDRLIGKQNNFYYYNHKLSSDSAETTQKETARTSALQSQLRQRKNDKVALKNALFRQTEVERKLKAAQDEFAALESDYRTTEAEHRELYEAFEGNIKQAQDQSNRLNETLEAKLKGYLDALRNQLPGSEAGKTRESMRVA
jgi:hypothetical protein